MAASSEIRFKIGADTSALSSAFVKAQSMAAVAGKQIERKFGFKDAFKGLMTGMGIGSVDAIADAVVRPFQLGMDRAKDMLAMTTRMREISNNEVIANSGRKTGIEVLRKEVRNLNVDIEMQQKLVNELNANPINFINGQATALVREAEQELLNMKVRQAEIVSQVNIDTKATARATAEWAREQDLLGNLAEAELREAGDREKLQIRLNHLVRDYKRIVARGDIGTDKERNNLGQQFAIQNQLKLLGKKSSEEQTAPLVELGASFAGRDPGRTPKPRPRGRSEMERIADRGMAFQAQADEALRTGRSPGFIANLARKGSRDLGAAGEKAGMIDKKDAQALGGIFQKAVTELQEIRKNLAPTQVNKGGRK
jgi:hypothetical protein